MKKSIGIESQAFVRDARNARRAHFGRSAGAGVPVSAVARVAAMIFFWSGQMIDQTLIIITVPSPPPTPIAIVRLLPPWRTDPTATQAAARTMTTTTTASIRPSFSGPPATERR